EDGGGGKKMESGGRQVLACRGGGCGGSGGVTCCESASLSDAARASDRASPACRHDRHRRATDGTMAFGTPRPAIRHREPARRVHHDRDRGGWHGALLRVYGPVSSMPPQARV